MPKCTWIRIVLGAAVCLGVVASRAPGQPQPAPQPKPTTPTEALPFRFVVRDLSLVSRGEPLLQDKFEARTRFAPPAANRAIGTTPYVVNVGRVGVANLRNNTLVLDHTTTGLAMWNVAATLVTLPVGPNGAYTFGAERLPLELAATVASPKIGGAEKFVLGIMDTTTLHAVAAIAIGIPGIPGRIPPIPGGGGGGGGGGPSKDNLKNRGDLVSNPAVMLIREEEPQIREHIMLDNVEAVGLQTAQSVRLTLRIGQNGEISGAANIVGGQRPGQITLTPKIDQQFEAFYKARQAIDVRGTKFSAVVYSENLPKPKVFAIDTPTISAQTLAANATVSITIHGVGLGLDSHVEVVPADGAGPAAKVANVQLANLNLLLTADVTFSGAQAKAYTVRVRTGGQVLTAPVSLRVQ